MKKNKSDQRQGLNPRSNCTRTYPQTTQVKQTKEDPKTQDKLSKRTAIHCQKMKTNLHHPRKIDQIRINAVLLAGKTALEATMKKFKSQFGFVTEPTLSNRHNASITFVTTPTWYYFSRPSNLAFHDFTKRHKSEKTLRSPLGLELKFIPTPSLKNSSRRLRKSSYNRLFRSVHLRFYFAGKPPSKGTISYDPKLYVRSKWMPPHWTIPPVTLEERLSRFSDTLNKLFKTHKGKTNLLPYQQ